MIYMVIFSDKEPENQREDFNDLINTSSIDIDKLGAWIPNSVLELDDTGNNGFVFPHLAEKNCERISTSQFRDRNS